MNTYADYEEKRRIIAICDSELEYAAHLAEYLHNSLELPCTLQIYSRIEIFREFVSAENLALLVIAESLYDSGLLDEGYDHVLILNESGAFMEVPNTISKYQKVENIVAKIYSLCAQEESDLSSIRHADPMKLIGIYGPAVDSWSSAISYEIARLASVKTSVLYLNLDPYADVSKFSDCSFEGSIRDLVYYNDCAKEKFAAKLHMMTRSDGSLRILPPAHPWLQIRSIGQEQWQDLLCSIEQVSNYQYLVIFLSEIVDGVLEILRRCDSVVTFCKEDELSQIRMEQYETLLKETGYEDIYMKTIKFTLPEDEGGLTAIEELRAENFAQELQGVVAKVVPGAQDRICI